MEQETIKDRLRKLQALAEGGYEGEAKTAKLMLDKLCKQYGIDFEDILDTEKISRYNFNIGSDRIWLRLFAQCYCHVTGRDEFHYYQRRSTRSIVRVDLTAYQYVEISNIFAWHKANLKKDLKTTRDLAYDAYIQKHHLFPSRDKDSEEGQVDDGIDLAYIQRLTAMMNNLNDNCYHKQLEAH